MAELWIDAAVCNHKGKVRLNNEDNFYLNGDYMALEQMDQGGCVAAESEAGTQLYAVCDGMGGEAAGEQASHAVVAALKQLQENQKTALTEEALTACLARVSGLIYEDAHAHGMRSGTTFAGCWWQDGRMRVVHVGDSRVYRMRAEKLEQITTDHSEVQRMVSMGLLSRDAARIHPKRHVISQYLGMPVRDYRLVPTYCDWMEGKAGDRYLICSDGLTDMLDHETIELTLAKADNAKTACMTLAQDALQLGGRDNVTVLCLYLQDRSDTERWSRKQKILLSAGLVSGLLGLGFLAEWIFRML